MITSHNLQTQRHYLINKFESKTINSFRLVCVLSVVLLHSGVAHLVNIEHSNTSHYIQDVLTILPSLQLLFVLSGYLFFQGFTDEKKFTLYHYKQKLTKRIKTLLIPYLIWCLIGFLFSVFATHENQLVMSPINYVKLFTGDGVMGHPIGRAMWYIKSLIVFSLMSPIYYYVVRIFRHLTPCIALALICGQYISIDCPLFSPHIIIGVYLALYKCSISKLLSIADWRLCIMTFLVISLLNIFSEANMAITFIPAFIGLFVLLEKYPINQNFACMSSFIYFVHMYFCGSVRNMLYGLLPHGYFWYSVEMILTWCITVGLCVVIFLILKRMCKPVLSIMTGDRL